MRDPGRGFPMPPQPQREEQLIDRAGRGAVELKATLRALRDAGFGGPAVFHAVGHLPGVQEVRNDIVVRREVTAREIHARIAQTFRQLAEASASRVKVELRDGEATLTGTVRSAEERREAERAALGAPNVSVVNDCLVVTS